jgi:Protein of unknown function (DUF2510)
MTRAPGWLPDPTRRHELRYWDGDLWTADVSDRGTMSFDPHDVPVTPPPSDATWGPPPPTGAPPPADSDPPPDVPGRPVEPEAAPWPAPGVEPGAGRASEPEGTPSPFPDEGPAEAGRGPTRPTTGIDPTARFPPRATTAEPPTASSWAGGELGRRRRSSGRLVVGLVVLVAALGAALAVVLVGDLDGRSDEPSPAASGDRDPSGRDATGAGGGDGSRGDQVPAGSPTSRTSRTAPPSTDAREVMVAAVAEGIVEGSDGAIDQSQAECMGRELIDEIGLDRLAEVTEATTDQAVINPLGLLTEEERNGAMTRMRACVDQATLDSLNPGGG